MKAYVNDLDLETIEVIDYNGQKQEYSVQEILHVDETNYQQEFLKQPSIYAFWATVLEKGKLVTKQQEDILNQVHAKCYNRYYKQFLDSGTKPTKDMVEAQILNDEDYSKQLSVLNNTKYATERVQYLVKALEQRAQMLISYGADQRKEKDYGN